MSGFKLDDYVDVAERIREFATKFPDGSLQSEVSFAEHAALGVPGVLCKAYAYRNPDDPRPGVGHAFEPIPGTTKFTKDSEVMNAETSAWGRAIVALGFETKKIASADEVRNRAGSGGEPRGAAPATPRAPSTPKQAASSPPDTPFTPPPGATDRPKDGITDPQLKRLWAIVNERKVPHDEVKRVVVEVTGQERTHGIRKGQEYDAVVTAIQAWQAEAA